MEYDFLRMLTSIYGDGDDFVPMVGLESRIWGLKWVLHVGYCIKLNLYLNNLMNCHRIETNIPIHNYSRLETLDR